LDNWAFWAAIGAALLIAYAVLLWLGMVVWTYFDMKDRSHDPVARWVATVAVLLFWIPGFFLYLIFRPHETLSEAYERRLEAEALKSELAEQHKTCPTCRRPSREEYLLCPFCRTVLQEPCVHCERPLELSWVICPYCGTSGPRSPATAPPAQRPETSSGEPPPLVEPVPSAQASARSSRPRTTAQAGEAPAAEAGASTPTGPTA
jgi:hypothetical protein